MKCPVEIFATLLMFSSFLICLTMHIAWVKGKHNSLMRQFFGLQILLLIWTGGDLSRMLLNDYQLEWLIVRLQYGAICFVGWIWLVFCLNYVESAWLTKRRRVYLALWPLACYIAALTNDWHHCFFLAGDPSFNRFGFLYYYTVIGSYLYCVLGAVILLRYVFRRYKYMRFQVYILIFSVLIPFVLSVLVVLRVVGDAEFDFTPLSFNITSVFLLIGMIRYKLMNIMPIALRKIVAQIREIVVVVDDYNRIIEYNQAAVVAFPELVQLKMGENLFDVLEALRLKYHIKEQIKYNAFKSGCYPDQEVFLEQTGQWFVVKVQPVYTPKKEILGQIISANDITEYKHLMAKLNQKNTELTLLNRQLQEQAAVAEELAVVKERDRVVQDIHDNLGQTMTLLVTTLQLCKINCRINPREVEVKLNQALEFTNNAIRQTRQALYRLAPPHCDNDKLSVVLPELINEFKRFGMNIQLLIEGDEYILSRDAAKIIYHLCQEALTNALRHGKSEQVMMKFKYTEDKLYIKVIDDGLGCANFKAGIGLSGMEQRIKSLNGQIGFVSYANTGFMILVELPKPQLLLEKNL